MLDMYCFVVRGEGILPQFMFELRKTKIIVSGRLVVLKVTGFTKLVYAVVEAA